MVRLKGCFLLLKVTPIWKFQFHYGTIKSLNRMSFPTSETLFQFHYGTIKSGVHDAMIILRNWFQFHYGTIKRWRTGKLDDMIKHFNSTMVRLKDWGIFSHSFWNNSFQFHYGTIKSLNLTGFVKSLFSISIPLWYD